MMTALDKPTAAETAYLDGFSAGEGWLAPVRHAAFADFAATGLPHRRLEDWKWTDLKRLIDGAYPPAAAPGRLDRLPASAFDGIARARLVFVDGRYDEARSKPPASGLVEVARLGSGEKPAWLAIADAGTDPIDRLNLANVSDGAAVRIPAGSNLDVPLELMFVTTGNAPVTVTTRNVIVVEAGASATILESHLGAAGSYVCNAVTQVHLGDGARLDRVKLQQETAQAFHLSNLVARLGARARLNDFTLTMGGRATRQQGFVTFDGEHASAAVSGAYLLRGRQHADTRLVVDHAVPNCESRELFKCVMDDDARGIFQGKVIVRPDAQKTDGKQSSHALLLSDRAEFDAKPELEIYADDVVCGHGATSGDLDEDPLFYLMARGIPEKAAKAMLIEAFAGEAFDTVANEAVRGVLGSLAHDWLTGEG